MKPFEQDEIRITTNNKAMKKNNLFYGGKAFTAVVFAATALAFTSCARDGYDDDERWDNGVYNTQLEAPSADDITITASADGSQQTISWPVVMGAGGYHAVLTNTTTDEVVKDTLIDGTSFATTRMEDCNYTISLSVLGNEEHNNTGSDAVVKAFSTFSATFGTIPAGSDLAEWFEQNPIEAGHEGEMLCYDLEAGGEYTLSKDIDFKGNQVTLRTTDANNKAKVTMTGDASFRTYSPFTLKYLSIDMSASTEALIKLSAEPDASLLGATGTGDYYNIQGAITVNGCDVEGVTGNFVYDSNVKYCVETLLITNCKIHLATVADNLRNQSIITFQGGFANTFTMNNSTMWQSGVSTNYLLRYNNSGRSTRAGYTTNSINYTNCTLYNIVKSGQMGNYSAFSGQACSSYTVTNNIFVDCGNNQVARRIVAGRVGSGTATFGNNTYMFDGAFENTAGYDDSGTNIESDPGFADPTNGDFTVSGSEQIARGTGDPRWLPAN